MPKHSAQKVVGKHMVYSNSSVGDVMGSYSHDRGEAIPRRSNDEEYKLLSSIVTFLETKNLRPVVGATDGVEMLVSSIPLKGLGEFEQFFSSLRNLFLPDSAVTAIVDKMGRHADEYDWRVTFRIYPRTFALASGGAPEVQISTPSKAMRFLVVIPLCGRAENVYVTSQKLSYSKITTSIATTQIITPSMLTNSFISFRPGENDRICGRSDASRIVVANVFLNQTGAITPEIIYGIPVARITPKIQCTLHEGKILRNKDSEIVVTDRGLVRRKKEILIEEPVFEISKNETPQERPVGEMLEPVFEEVKNEAVNQIKNEFTEPVF